MGRTYAVSTQFKAQDKMSSVFKKMGKSSSVFGSMLKANIAGAAIQKGFSILAGGLRTVTSEFISFEGSLISAGAKFQDINTATVEGQESLKQLGLTARQVGATTKFSATEAAQGLDFLAMAGFTATQAMIALPGTTNLAVVAQVDLATATDIASDSLGAFGKDVTDLTDLNDLFAKTMVTSNTNMIDMFEAVKKGAPSFTAAGQTMYSFNALLGTMANSGVKGSEAGTALRNVMLRLAKPTSEAEGVIDDLGVKLQDSKGNFLDIINILGQFEKGLKGMGTAQKTAALSTVFGARAVTGVNLLLQEGSSELTKYRDALLDSGGAASTMAGIIGGSLGNKLATLRSSLIEMGFKFVSVFQDKAGKTIDRLVETVNKIDLSGLAIKIDSVINKLIDNIPAIKRQFEELIPDIKEFASQMVIISGAIYDSVNKFNEFTGGKAFKVVATLFGGGYRREALDRMDARKAEVSAPNAREEEARAQITTTNIDIMLAKELQLADQSSGRGAPNINISTMGANN